MSDEAEMNPFIIEQRQWVTLLTINRPEVLNALNREVLEKLIEWLEQPPIQTHALILTGSGDKAFISGADIHEMAKMESKDILQFCELGQRLTNALESAPFLTVAAINGYALGGGLEIALACDFIYASEKAHLGFPEIKLGMIPGFGGTQRLTRMIGIRKSKELILGGESISAQQALNIGLVNKVCSQDTLIDESIKSAREINSRSFSALLQAKNAINGAIDLPIEAGMQLERTMCAVCFSTQERKEAMQSFLKKS